MKKLSDELLQITFQKAVELKLDLDFIILLKEEIEKREISKTSEKK